MFVSIWLFLGACGSALIWRDEMLFNARLNRAKPIWCPTPRALLFGTVSAVGGPAIFIMAVAITVITFLESLKKSDNWFTRPICRHNDTDTFT